MDNKLDLSIIIVSWKVRELLRKCLQSIFKQSGNINFEVFVVENNSQDGSAEMVKEEFPAVKLIVNQENLGFAKANNQAIKLAKGRYILLLNPDTEILENALEKMVLFMAQNPSCGTAGCQLLNPNGSLQASVRRFPRFLDQAGVLLKLHNFLPSLGIFKRYLAEDMDYEQKQEVNQVMGSFFFIKREVIKKIGLLDENFWIWFEEVDYCKRVKNAGWKIYYTPEAKIIHYGFQSFKHCLSVKRQRMFNQSLLYYFKKHHCFLSYLGLLILWPFSIFLAWIVQVLNISKIK